MISDTENIASKNIAFRFDGGGSAGFGHASRCISLAHELESRGGIKVHAYVRSDSSLENFLGKSGVSFSSFAVATTEESILKSIFENRRNNALVLDHLYPYSAGAIEKLRSRMPVCMLHNECEGTGFCDSVVFPAAHFSESILDRLIGSMRHGSFYHGFDYVLLGSSCLQHKKTSTPSHISFASGASDPEGVLLRLLDWLAVLKNHSPVKALYGQSFLHGGQLAMRERTLPPNASIEPFSAEAFFNSRYSVCTFGVSVYELIYHQIPFLTVAHIAKSAQGSHELAEKIGLPVDLGLIGELSEDYFATTLAWLIDPANEHHIRRRLSGLIDGRGHVRVAEIILSMM